jgi:hypothetical protein
LTPVAAFAATGLDPVRLKGATDTGALQRASVPVTIALAPRDKAGLAAAAARGGGLTPAQFNAQFAPASATVDAVRTWAAASSLDVVSVSANRTLVRVSGSAANVGKAFGTTLESFKSGSTTFFAPATKARVPAAFSGQTTAVLGLSNLGRVGFSPQAAPDFPASYGPQDLATLYGAPAWQGIWARTQGARGPLGFAGPVLYGEPASAFNDITLGANGAPNTPGWDYVTGRGTPIVSALVSG